MHVVLVRPPFVDIDNGPPIGLAYLSGALKEAGHSVTIRDFNVGLHQEFLNYSEYTRDFTLSQEHPVYAYAYAKLDSYCDEILALDPDVVGFSLSYPTAEFGFSMAKRLQNEVRCIVGGPQATFHEEELLSTNSFRAVVSGYGEEGIVKALSTDGIIHASLRSDREYVPDYSAIDLSQYNHRYSLVTTRGCPNRCTFCTQHLPYFYHSLDSVTEQIASRNDIRYLMYNDSNINVNAARTTELFQRIKEIDRPIPSHVFGMQVVKGYEAYIPLMAATGVNEVRLGLESGSRRERDSMVKPAFDNEDVIRMVTLLSEYGITTWCQFIFSYPDQTDEDRDKTLSLMHQLNSAADQNLIKHFWFKFVVHHGTEEFFHSQYGVDATSPRTWTNQLYAPQRIATLKSQYETHIPSNAMIVL